MSNAVLNILRLRLASVGVRQSSNGELLLAPADLSGDGWVLLGEYSWRTGFLRLSGPARRARRARSLTAIRRFQLGNNAGKNLLIQVIPCASSLDAEIELSTAPSRLIRNPRSALTIVNQRTVDGIEVSGATNIMAIELNATGADKPTAERIICGSAGKYVFAVYSQGYENSWVWEEIIDIATQQTAKLLAAG